MANLKQCDRCRSVLDFAPDMMGVQTSETREREDRTYELCAGCQTKFDWFMQNKVSVPTSDRKDSYKA